MLRSPAAAVVTALGPSAQVAPASSTSVDGNSGSGAPFDQGIGCRFQQILHHVPGPVTHGDQDVLQVTHMHPTSLPVLVRGTGVVISLQ